MGRPKKFKAGRRYRLCDDWKFKNPTIEVLWVSPNYKYATIKFLDNGKEYGAHIDHRGYIGGTAKLEFRRRSNARYCNWDYTFADMEVV